MCIRDSFADADTDYDGDSLSLSEEYSLWKTYRDHDGLDPLIYSDGNQYSLYDRDGSGHRPGAPRHDPFAKQADFLHWAGGRAGYLNAGYGTVTWRGSTYDVRDFNHDHAVSPPKPTPTDPAPDASPGYARSEQNYFDFDATRCAPSTCGKLSDNERDEDADGLTNFDEAHGRLQPGYWAGCYRGEVAFGVPYAETDIVDPDSDGDGVRDGADDQDHDDLSNIAEMSRNAASGHPILNSCDDKDAIKYPRNDPSDMGRVNPFNPCLPDPNARTCSLHPGLGGAAAAPFDGSPYFVLN